MILARTLKGKGVKAVEGKEGWHGKPFKKGEETDKAIAELKAQLDRRRAGAGDRAAGVEDARRRAARLLEDAARRTTSRASRSRPAKPGARRSPRSAASTRASSRSTPT